MMTSTTECCLEPSSALNLCARSNADACEESPLVVAFLKALFFEVRCSVLVLGLIPRAGTLSLPALELLLRGLVEGAPLTLLRARILAYPLKAREHHALPRPPNHPRNPATQLNRGSLNVSLLPAAAAFTLNLSY